MFERYTERARRVLFFARYEASLIGSRAIETEHLLLGLLKEGKGLTSRILADRGISYAIIRDQILSAGVRLPAAVEIPFSEGTKRALRHAAKEADRLRHSYIGSEHLLLGLLVDGHELAATILTRHGMTLESVRADVVRLLSEKPEPSLPLSDATVEIAAGVIYYVASSVDGYTATPDGRKNWLEPFHKDFGYVDFDESIEAVVLGSRTYEQALAADEWPHASKPCWVLSSRPLRIASAGTTITSKQPREVVQQIEAVGHRRIWLVGGATLAAAFLHDEVITHCVISVIPIVLGGGLPLFAPSAPPTSLELVHSKTCAQGIVQNFYVRRGRATT